MHAVFITAHPDDAEILAGGMICAYRAMGASVTILCVTDGARGGADDPAALAARRAKEAQAGATELGAELVMLGYPDGKLTGMAGLAADIADHLQALVPDLVIAHPAQDYHSDHGAVGLATSLAVSFHAPLAWLEPLLGVGALPTHYIDITLHQASKERAILCHESQDPERFVELSRVQGRFRATQCGSGGYAEAIRHEPRYPFADIRGLLPPPPTVRAVADRSRTGFRPNERESS